MAREAHSASSIELGARCPRAWALRYIAGIKDKEYAWDDPKAPYRARSSALGKEVHRRLERYLKNKYVEWHDRPGEIAASGVRHLPPPAEIARTEFEFTVTIDGVKWRGVIDAETKRGLLIDHKSTRVIALYAHTPESLAKNFQACLYKAARRGSDAGPTHRWVYYQTAKDLPAASRKVECTITVAKALAAFRDPETLRRKDVLARRDTARGWPTAPTALAKRLDALKSVDDAPQNTLACWDYGGCEYHVEFGGPCNAHRSIGALVAISRKPKEKTLANDKFNKAKAKAASRTRSTAPVTEPEESGGEPEEVAAPVAKPRGRPRKVAATAPPVEAPEAGSVADALGAYEAAKQALLEAKAVLAAAVAALD